jgi:hypothetical protein
MAEKDFEKPYTDFWSINKDQSGASAGHVWVSSKHNLGQVQLQFGPDNLKAISPISCKEGYILAEDTNASGNNKYKEYPVLKKASLFHKIGISSYGGKKYHKKRSSSSKRKPARRLRVKRSRSGSRR